jgi:hypothetical protein
MKELTIEDVRAQVARVSHKVDGIEFRWNVSRAYEWLGDEGRWMIDEEDHVVHVGFFIQIEYDEADIDDPGGALEVQQGRKWFVGKHVSESEVIQTMLKAALASAEHRTREWFLVDGRRIYGPHMDANELSTLLRAKTGRFGAAGLDYGDGRSLTIRYDDGSDLEPGPPS